MEYYSSWIFSSLKSFILQLRSIWGLTYSLYSLASGDPSLYYKEYSPVLIMLGFYIEDSKLFRFWYMPIVLSTAVVIVVRKETRAYFIRLAILQWCTGDRRKPFYTASPPCCLSYFVNPLFQPQISRNYWLRSRFAYIRLIQIFCMHCCQFHAWLYSRLFLSNQLSSTDIFVRLWQ